MYPIIFCAPLAYRPGHEAIAKEISLLVGAFPNSSVVTLPPFKSSPWQTSDGQARLVHPWRLICPVTARLALRGARLLHVFTPLPLPRRVALLLRHCDKPSLVTVISCGGFEGSDLATLGVARFVIAECERDYQWLLAEGLPDSRLRLVTPATGIKAQTFPVPEKNMTLLFGSSPRQPAEFSQRGVDLLVAAARRCPAVDFHLLWRPGAETCLSQLPDLPNLTLDRTLYSDITQVLAGVHAVVAPFRAGGKAKSVPLSVVEALQCGLPVLVSNAVGMAELVSKHACGVVFEPDADHLVAAINSLQDNYLDYRAAVSGAADMFGAQEFCQAYSELVAAIHTSQ